MMNARYLILLILLGLLALPFALPVRSQSGIIVNNADAVRDTGATPYPNPITLSPRIVLQAANALRQASLAAPDGSLQALFVQVADRIILQSANAGRREILIFPREIIGDTALPQISNVVVTRVGTSVRVTWTTNEFANSTVLYGTQTGSYPQSATNPLFERQHEINLTGLRGGTTYFLRVRSADLSGNTATGAERSIVAGGGVYLPYVARRR
ncbi:MAG: fibronectin type III domain-containing protein [Anaerolineae bacterium]